ncbi:RHS repeat-associated core domain-containing protein [Amycolatopsis sp. NPDC059657]|uniref:RHS repeat-associated core domain-containing protein n=1 Tax=Amycolatopsis sp. NPDC059657 TaxID=3346899 RepID=UPI00366DE54A
MPEGNPLVAQAQSQTTGVTGIGILESANDLASGVKDGSWVEGGLGAVGVGLEALSLVVDPIGTLAQYGVSWLIEHVKPLKDCLDWLAGNPPVIQSFSDTWANVAREVNAIAGDLSNEAKGGTAGWSGAAGDAYRGEVAEQVDAVAGAASLCDGISTGVMVMGQVVAAVRETVRDLIATLVGKLITWALEEACTLGFATPLVAAQATAAITSTISKVSQVIRKLVKTISNVGPKVRKIVDKLGEIIEKLSKLGKKLGKRADGTSPSAARKAGKSDVDAPKEHTSPSSAHDTDGTSPSSATKHSSADTTPSSSKPDDAGPGAGTHGSRGDGAGTSESATRPGSARDQAANPRDTATPLDGRFCKNDPIDVATGEMVLGQVDVDLPGLLPLVLERTHVSSYRAGRLFGPSWASTLDQRLEIDELGVCYVAPDGVILVYPHPASDDQPVLAVEGKRWPLVRASTGEYRIEQAELGRTLHFASVDAGVARMVALDDRNGNSMRFDYAGATIVGVRHSGGYRIRVGTHDGLVVNLALAPENGTEVLLTGYQYNARNRLVAVQNSSGSLIKFDYDDDGRITRWVDRNGRWYRYLYDAEGRCVANEGEGGFLSGTFTYDRTNLLTRFVDSLGNQSTFHLNERNQIVKEVAPEGGVVLREWDRYDRLLSRTDELGRTTRFRYDDNGRIVELIHPDGSAKKIWYGESGLPVTVIDPDGATWRQEYDERGNLVLVEDPVGAITRYRYDDRGGVVEIIDALGQVLVFESDSLGLTSSVTDMHGATTRYYRDQFGRPTMIVDAVGGETRFAWTVEGNLTSRVLPGGEAEYWRYDGEGNRTEHVDAVGNRTVSEFTCFDLVRAETRADGSRLDFEYDTNLNLTAVTNAAGQVWRYHYDPAGRRVEEVDFDGRRITYAHDAAGQLIELVNGAGEVVEFEYDLMGNLIARRSSEGVSTFAFDRAGRMVQAANSDAEIELERDALGRIRAEVVNGRRLESHYDLLGRRTRRRTPSGLESEWAYEGSARPSSLLTAGRTFTFGYDLAGREIERLLDTGTIVAQSWDSNHRLVSQTVSTVRGQSPESGVRAKVLQGRRYRYRQDGFVRSVDDQNRGRREYTLDQVGRVTAVRGAGWVEQYAYDVTGNVTNGSWPAHDVAAQGPREYRGNLLERAGGTLLRHDSQGRLVQRSKKRLSAKPATWNYAWDSEDRLVGVVTPDGARWKYVYDPFGRRMAKLLLGEGDLVVGRVDFVWDGGVLAEQIDSAGRTTTWEWDADGLRPLAQIELTQDEVDRRFYSIVTDLIGSPAEMVDVAGNLVWEAHATLWGAMVSGRATGATTALRFPGQYYDEESGLCYNYFRHYDPESGRYVSTDPLGLAAGPNPRSYVDNPMQWIDPFGLAPCRQRPRIEDGNLKEGWQHIDSRHITGNHPSGHGDLMPPGTTREQVHRAATDLVRRGERISDPSKRIQVYERRGTVNGMHARFRVTVDSHDGNRVITFHPVGKSV